MIFLLKAPFLVDFPACKAVWWHLPSSGRWISCWKPQGTSSCIWGLTKISGGWWKLPCETSMVRSGTDNDSINIQWIFNDRPKILMISTCDFSVFRSFILLIHIWEEDSNDPYLSDGVKQPGSNHQEENVKLSRSLLEGWKVDLLIRNRQLASGY